MKTYGLSGLLCIALAVFICLPGVAWAQQDALTIDLPPLPPLPLSPIEKAEIRSAVQKMETNRRLVESAKASCAYAEEQLKGEQKRFENGVSDNFRVLDRQANYSAALGSELQALISYKKSIIAFQKAEYTLLESKDFTTAARSSGNVPDLH
jgi:hypothetical protein